MERPTHRGLGPTDDHLHGPMRGVRPWAAGAATVLVLVGMATPASGQVIRGVLVDDATSFPVPDASVTLLGEERPVEKRTLSDSVGVFWFDADLGPYRLVAERVGYGRTESLPFQVAAMDTIDVEFRITADAIALAPLSVTIGGPSGRELFEERATGEYGFHFTPQMVDSLRPSEYVGEIFRSAEKTWVNWTSGRGEDGRYGPLPVVKTRLGESGCVYWVVDRTPVPAPFFGESFWGVPPLSELTPDDLVAIEVYRAWHEVPDDFVKQLRFRNVWERDMLRLINRKNCGLIVIWTEDGW